MERHGTPMEHQVALQQIKNQKLKIKNWAGVPCFTRMQKQKRHTGRKVIVNLKSSIKNEK